MLGHTSALRVKIVLFMIQATEFSARLGESTM